MSDLKPCPFCGSEAIVPAMPIGITDDDTPVECTNMDCNASDVTFDKGAWNTRPIEDALCKEIAQLQADNRSLVEQINEMAMKQNQEVIEWHKYPEEKPTETDCRNATIIPSCVGVVIKYKKSECEKPRIGVDTYWFDFPKSGKAMFESQFDHTVIILAWAYLPKGAKHDS